LSSLKIIYFSIHTMKKLCPLFPLLVFLTYIPVQEASAQYREDALRYTFEVPGQDAANIAMGGASVALGQDFGSFVLNPATSAMRNKSYFSIGIGTRDVRETDVYLGQSRDFSDTQTGITNFGFVFQAPTVRDRKPSTAASTDVSSGFGGRPFGRPTPGWTGSMGSSLFPIQLGTTQCGRFCPQDPA
jgi:hypothetical protein